MLTSKQTPEGVTNEYGFGFSTGGDRFGHGGAYWLGNKISFLIVPDVERAVLDGSEHNGPPYRGPFRGVMHLPNWTTVRFEAEAPEGEIDSVTISDQPYDLEFLRKVPEFEEFMSSARKEP